MGRKTIFWLAVSTWAIGMVLWVAEFLFMAGTAVAQVSGPKPRRGEWLCWATNAEAECGTYGWHKRKPVALKAAMDLCDKRCGEGCAEDYCEVLK